MAVPSIFTVNPSVVSTAGGYLVSIYGDGFRVRTIPDLSTATGPIPAPGPTVRVTFGDKRSRRVLVPRSNRLLVELPMSPIPPVLRKSSAAELSFVASTRTISRASGSFVDDGFVPGCRIVVSGSTSNDSSDENPLYTVATVSASELVLEAHETLVDESAVACRLTCRSYGEGKVDVTVENLDDDGEPIPGESVTAPLAVTYRRVQLADSEEVQRLVRELVRQMRLGIIPNVSSSTHTDYDADPLSDVGAVELAELPGIAVVGPETEENREYSTNVAEWYGSTDGEQGEHLQRRVPFTVDLVFRIVGMAELKRELLALHSLTLKFFHRNKYLYMDRDENDPDAGEVRWEMDWQPGGTPSVAGGANTSNLRSFSGTFVVRGFDIEDLPGLEGEGVVDRSAEVEELVLTSLQMG